MPQAGLTPLAHHIDVDWLRDAYRLTRKTGGVGVDGQTATEYAANLAENLQSLCTVRSLATTTARHRCVACTAPKGTGRRPARSGYRALKTRCFRGRWRWC